MLAPPARGVQDIMGGPFNFGAPLMRRETGNTRPSGVFTTGPVDHSGIGMDLSRVSRSSSSNGRDQDLQDCELLANLASQNLQWGENPSIDMQAHGACSRILDALKEFQDQRTQDMKKLKSHGLLKIKPPPPTRPPGMNSIPRDLRQDFRQQQLGSSGGAQFRVATGSKQVGGGFACQPNDLSRQLHNNFTRRARLADDSTLSNVGSSSHGSAGFARMTSPASMDSVGSSDGRSSIAKKLISQEIKRVLKSRKACSPSPVPSNPGVQNDLPTASMSHKNVDHQNKENATEIIKSGLCAPSKYVIKNTFVEPEENLTDIRKISARDYFSEQPFVRSFTLSRENLPKYKPPSRDDLPRVIKALSSENLPMIEKMDDEEDLDISFEPGTLSTVVKQEAKLGHVDVRSTSAMFA